MVHPTHLIVSLFVFVLLLGIVNGFTIISREPKLSPPALSPSLMSTSTEKPGGTETKTTQLPHHVPLDIIATDRSKSRAISLVKREVNPVEEGKDNGMLYDPNLMIMPKRSTAALNKMLLSLPGFYEPSSRYNTNDIYGESSHKERNYLEPSTSNMDSLYLQSAPQRRGQKDSKKYLRCFFNVVSCY